MTDDGRVTISTEWFPPRGLQALGRIVELSAKLDEVGRTVLAAALGVSPDAADALFLGDRFNILLKRLKQLKPRPDSPQDFNDLPGAAWISEAVDWMAKVDKLQEERNKWVHRPPVWMTGDNEDEEPVLGWGRGRYSHKLERADGQPLVDLISQMERAYREGISNLTVDPFGEDDRPRWSAATVKPKEDAP